MISLRLKDLPEMERPRERLLLCGVESLSFEELLAIIIKYKISDPFCPIM